MNIWLSAGLIFTFCSILFILARWGHIKCTGPLPVKTLTFIAILFTSGLDVGLIMFPLTEFGGYADLTTNPEYGFANPLAIEFGYWGFLIWGFYFLTCFYFCVIEPKVKFFEIPWVKFINNTVIIGTCAFTAYLLLLNFPWYAPQLGDGETIVPAFYAIVFTAICLAVYSSTNIRYVKILSLASTGAFFALIAFLGVSAFIKDASFAPKLLNNVALLGDYFSNLHRFLLPMNDYHAFYLFWWFSWSIMIGQFTARFVGGLSARQVFAAMLVFPSIPIAIWFAVLYYYHSNGIAISGLINLAMISVGILFVINSLDSLVRLYTDNLGLTVERLGKPVYLAGNIIALSALTLLFQLDFLKIEWIGALVIGLFFICFAHVLRKHQGPIGQPRQAITKIN